MKITIKEMLNGKKFAVDAADWKDCFTEVFDAPFWDDFKSSGAFDVLVTLEDDRAALVTVAHDSGFFGDSSRWIVDDFDDDLFD